MIYWEQLHTDEWEHRRQQIFKLRGKKCLRCDTKKKLHIHHIKYTGLAWQAPDEDLICLCKDCHKLVHSEDDSFTNEDCRELITKYHTKFDKWESIITDFIQSIELGKEYLNKDLNLILKALSIKYEYEGVFNLKEVENLYDVEKIKIGRYCGSIITNY